MVSGLDAYSHVVIYQEVLDKIWLVLCVLLGFACNFLVCCGFFCSLFEVFLSLNKSGSKYEVILQRLAS